MNVFKRIEVWILLLLVVGVVLWVLLSNGNSEDGGGAGTSIASDGASSANAVSQRALTRDYGNAKLVLDFHFENHSSEPMLVAPPAVRLLDATGADIPPFFLPFTEHTEVAPGRREKVTQAYWLEAADLEGELWLEISGERLPVKDSSPFDLKSIDNQETREFDSPVWAAP